MYNLANNLEKDYEKCQAICNKSMDISNETYFILEKNIKKITSFIDYLEQDLVSTKFNDFSYQNSLLDKNFDELVNFESYLNSKSIYKL
jgi:hypothetical protein